MAKQSLASMMYRTTTAPQSSAAVSAPQPSPSGGTSGYGSPGSVYTNFVAPNAHTACGTLCK